MFLHSFIFLFIILYFCVLLIPVLLVLSLLQALPCSFYSSIYSHPPNSSHSPSISSRIFSCYSFPRSSFLTLRFINFLSLSLYFSPFKFFLKIALFSSSFQFSFSFVLHRFSVCLFSFSIITEEFHGFPRLIY